MSEQQAGDPTPPGPEPLTRPAAGWMPPPMPTAASTTPAPGGTADAGTPTRGGRAIDAYTPRRSPVPALVVLAAVVAAVVVFWSTTGPTAVAPSPTPSVTAHPSARPSPSTPGQLFVTDNERAEGTWLVADSEWSDAGLSVLVEVYVNSGDLTPSFMALPDNAAPDFVKSGTALHDPAFPVGTMRAGESARGWLYFPITRDATMVFLGNTGQPQLSGQDVPG